MYLDDVQGSIQLVLEAWSRALETVYIYTASWQS